MGQLTQIQTFIHVVDRHGFANTAKFLGVSTAAVSKQITALEKRLGIQLLERSTRRVQLTEVGVHYYEQCKRVLTELQEAEAMVSHMQEEPSGYLRVMLTNYFALYYVFPYLQEFMDLYPKIQLEIEIAERKPDLPSENIDLVMGVGYEGSPDLVRRRITTTKMLLCGSPAYFEKYGVPQKPSDLTNHRVIMHRAHYPENTLVFKNEETIRVNPILRLNHTPAIVKCAVSGIGIAMLRCRLVKEAIDQGLLQKVLVEYQQLEQPVYLYYQKSRYVQPKIRCFIDFFVDKAIQAEKERKHQRCKTTESLTT